MTRAVLPHMIAKKSGKIINTAQWPPRLAPLLAHYSLEVCGGRVTQALAKEVAQYGITVNAVCPGFVLTSMQDREVVWEGQLRGMSPEAVRQEYIDRPRSAGCVCRRMWLRLSSSWLRPAPIYDRTSHQRHRRSMHALKESQSEGFPSEEPEKITLLANIATHALLIIFR